jgi:pimeloyl-ACP methyl ester carboxylesterase
MATSLFLPDFVGYPFCYLGLRAVMPDSLSAIYIDYNEYWPYESVEELADAIIQSLGTADVRIVIGYSFGAYVAIEVANTLAGAGHAAKLVLIDPPRITAVSSLSEAEIESRLHQRPEYQYVFELIECELTSLACMVTNIRALGRLPERLPIQVGGTVLVAGDRAKAEEVLRGFEYLAGSLQVVCLEDCDHRSIVAHHAVRDLILWSGAS